MSTNARGLYNTFDRNLFSNINEAVAWENLQHSMFRANSHVHFTYNLGMQTLEGVISTEDRGLGRLLVKVLCDPERGTLNVLVYDQKRSIARAVFETWDHPTVSEAVVSFINRAAER